MNHIILIVALLAGASDQRLFAPRPARGPGAPARQAAENEEDYLQYLTPEQKQQLALFEEEQHYNQLENARDDDMIYSFGLEGQQDPGLAESKKQYISKFPIIMNLFSRVGEFYARSKAPAAAAAESVEAQLQSGLRDFEVTKELTVNTVYHYSKFSAELEALFHNANFVDMTPRECAEFWGFGELFERMMQRHDQSLAEFKDLQHKLELRVYEFTTKAKTFLEALYALRHFDRYLFSFFEPLMQRVAPEDAALDTEAKVGASVAIIERALEFKVSLGQLVEALGSGMDNMLAMREDLRGLLARMDELPPLLNTAL